MVKKEKRKLNKFKIGIVIFIFFVFILITSGFGRFVYNNFKDRYLTSKKFYFTSDLLKMNNEEYTYSNWDGLGIYKLDIDLYSKINDLLTLEEDLDYTIMVNFPDNVNCAINTTEFVEPEIKENGDKENLKKPISKTNTIQAQSSNTDKVSIFIKAIDEETVFYQGEEINIEVTAYTTEPYRKSLSASFKIRIATSYTIEDKINDKYAILTIRNSSNIAQDVTLRINPDFLYLDMNDDVFLYNKEYGIREEIVEDIANFEYGHIDKVVFEMPKESVKKIKLYKKDKESLVTLSNAWFTVSKKSTE